MKHNGKKNKLGGNGLFCLYFHITIHHRQESEEEHKQDRNLEEGTDKKKP